MFTQWHHEFPLCQYHLFKEIRYDFSYTFKCVYFTNRRLFPSCTIRMVPFDYVNTYSLT